MSRIAKTTAASANRVQSDDYKYATPELTARFEKSIQSVSTDTVGGLKQKVHALPLPSLRKINVALAGYGLHADKTYSPQINELRGEGYDVQLCAAVDIEAARDAVTARAAKHEGSPELTFIEPFSGAMPAKVEVAIDRLVDRHRINALIVATRPEAHAAYIDYGIRHNISVMVDKPVTTRPDAVNDIDAARGIKKDIQALNREYKKAKRRASKQDEPFCVMVNAQRRWSPHFDFVGEKVEEISRRRECPITSISAFHADGQWRLTAGELIGLDYHGYNGGNGKISHSGYHEIDMVYQLLRKSWGPDNKPDRALLLSSLVQPNALLTQIPRRQLVDMFGAEFENASQYTESDLMRIGNRLGEVDASMMIELKKDDVGTVGQAFIGLHHNSVSARSWLRPRKDLYKKMGRLKHEQWVIHSGPYQTIVVETRQAEDDHDQVGANGSELGGPNHLQISVFRNAEVLGGGRKLEVFQGYELADFNPERLHSQQVKMAALREFIDFLQGKIGHAELRSDLTDHVIPASLMSAAYESHVRRRAGRDGFVTVKL